MIIHVPFINSLRLRSILLLPPQPSNSLRPTRIRLFTNLPHLPSFSDIEDMQPVQDIDISTSPSSWQATAGPDGRDSAGRREVEEWPLKVQKMASVFSVTIMVVSEDLFEVTKKLTTQHRCSLSDCSLIRKGVTARAYTTWVSRSVF